MKYVWTGVGWVPVAEARMQAAAHQVAIHRDFAEPLLCHADGLMHSSKSTYGAAVKAAGCEVVGKSEMRRQLEGSRPRGLGGAPVSATLRRILQETGE
jgi:hypothetical protein